MKKFMAIFVAFLVAVGAVLCTERVHTGYVGVVYSAKGVEQQTISQGWHFMSPLKHVSEFPITQRPIMAQRNTQIGTLTLLLMAVRLQSI